MDLSTTYLGLRLPHPLMPGASPLCQDLGRAQLARAQGDGFHVRPFFGTIPLGRSNSMAIMKT